MHLWSLINRASLFFLGLAFLLYYRYLPAKNMAQESPNSIYEFTVKDVRGNDVPLSNYQGRVLLIVNVASKCGLTESNYKELNILYEKYKDQGFEILAFPCNQFAWQEPGTNEEIQEAVCTRFKAEFPIFEKVDVNGKNAAPLYKFLKSEKGGLLVDAIKWNFTKFLVSKGGKVVERYGPRTPPLEIEDLKRFYPGISSSVGFGVSLYMLCFQEFNSTPEVLVGTGLEKYAEELLFICSNQNVKV